MAIPLSSADYYRRQQSIVIRLLLALRRVWRQMDPSQRWDQQYQEGIGAQLVMLLTAAQVAATRDADAYIAAVLNELALGPQTTAGVLVPAGLAGLAGDGRTVEGLLAQAVVAAGRAFNRDFTAERDAAQQALRDLDAEASRARREDDAAQPTRDYDAELDTARSRIRRVEEKADDTARLALADAERFINTVAATVLSDTARAAEAMATAEREFVEGYVRMLNPPSCSRCVVLAGRFYRWNEGFLRHPNCDCRHIPASEAMSSDLSVNPYAYFESLTGAEQDKTFTAAGAEAIRAGADINQVVNARRGMDVAQIGGRDVLITLESSTRRGLANRTGRKMPARLMPESIFQIATDRAGALRLLRLNGFIL